jgi:hypothetical protein
MPITSVILENFKGVGQRVEIPLRAITLLFGANSAGKSTILQALLYLREILEHRHTDVDRLHVSGQSIDLGGFQKLVHKHDLARKVKIGVTVSVDDDGLNTYSRAPYSDDDDAEGIRIEDQLPLPLPNVHEVTVSVTIGWDPDFKHTHVFSYEVAINGQRVGEIHEPLWDSIEESKKGATLTMVEDHPIFSRVFRFGNPDHGRDHTGEEIVGPLGYMGSVEYGVLGVVLPNLGQPLRLLERPDTQSTQLSTQDAEELFSHVMVGAGQAVLDELKRTRYIGPLRIVPDRAYSAVRTDMQDRWADGSAAWDLLHKLDDDLRWLLGREQQFAQLGLGYRLGIYQYYEVARRSPLGKSLGDARIPASKGLAQSPLSPAEVREHSIEKRRFQITLEANGMEVSPSDVGVGVSQLVPVVIGAMAPGYNLLAVEQPELHVHPAIQCSLADVLALQVIDKDRQLLLETHSEHLMLRLLRRVRETTEGELPVDAPKLTPDDLSVLYVASDAEGMMITPLPVTEDGDFSRPWPKGFFSERRGELF